MSTKVQPILPNGIDQATQGLYGKPAIQGAKRALAARHNDVVTTD